MTREESLEEQVRALLEERTQRGKNWLSLPSVDPVHDLPWIIRPLKERGLLGLSTITCVPSEDDTGWWDVLVRISPKRITDGRSRCPDDDGRCGYPSPCEMGAGCRGPHV